MSLNEAIVEDDNLERASFGDVVLAGRLRRAIGWLNPAIPARRLG